MKVQLVSVGGPAKTAQIVVGLPAVLGRGPDVRVHLPHPLVSRHHCELFEVSNRLFVRDLNSLNGTFVGSERVKEAAVPDGELLTVGSITFRTVYLEDLDGPEVESTICADYPVRRPSDGGGHPTTA